jgi:hypothetical protein
VPLFTRHRLSNAPLSRLYDIDDPASRENIYLYNHEAMKSDKM